MRVEQRRGEVEGRFFVRGWVHVIGRFEVKDWEMMGEAKESCGKE